MQIIHQIQLRARLRSEKCRFFYFDDSVLITFLGYSS